MTKLKVAIATETIKEGDAIRGIGFHIQNLLEEFKKHDILEVTLVNTETADLSRYDLVHYQKFNPFFFNFPLRKTIKSVITIHDLISLIYPKAYPPGIKGSLRFFVQKLFIKQMDAIITISETSRKDIIRLLGVDPEKVFVTYLAAGDNFKKINDEKRLKTISVKYHLPEKFVLYVGDVNYNKNIMLLADACKENKLPLVIVGKQAASKDFDRHHPENKPFVEFLNKYDKDQSVKKLGYVAGEDLPLVFNLATIYCQPSLYEGFGLTVVQAFACGVPVIAARNNCLVEVGGDASLYFNPKDKSDLIDKIGELKNNNELRRQLIEKGLVRAKLFSWEKTAKETIDVYQHVLAK